MKNLYSLTPKYLASITRSSHANTAGSPASPATGANVSEKPAERVSEKPYDKSSRGSGRQAVHPAPVIETGSDAPPSDSWWDSILGEEEIDRHPAFSANRQERSAVTYDWSVARELYESDGITELTVTGVNRGGLLVEGERVRGFVPLSHLVGVPSLTSEEERQAAMHQRVGQALRAKIIEFDPEKGRVVFSERAAQSAPGRRAELLANVKVGDQLQGEVTNITNFGVFIDLGGMEGLVHLSEISWGRVHNPADFVQIGQKVDVEVISIDREQSRVALSLKRLQLDPWVTVPERYLPGAKVTCTVTHVTNFGAFASLEEGVEGLIHISEMSDGPFSHPRNIVSEGDEVTARIISVDNKSRRLALSMRPSVLADPQDSGHLEFEELDGAPDLEEFRVEDQESSPDTQE